jgi:hypothetical protein
MKNTFTKPADFWQERDFGAKISATFEFIGAHWRPLGQVLLYLVVPVALVQAILASILQTQIISAVRQHQASGATVYTSYITTFQSPWYLLSNILSVAFYVVLILSVYGYVMRCVYTEQPGTPVTVPEVWAVVKRKFVGTFFSFYGIWMLIGVGFLVLFIPGLYLAVALSLFFAVSVLENNNFAANISRCLQLTRGKWWSTFGLIFIVFLLVYLAVAGIGTVAVLLGGAKNLILTTRSLSQSSPALVIFSLFAGLLALLLYVPAMLLLAFQYFNLVERKEGIGLRLLVDKLGDTHAAPTAESGHYQPDNEGEY